MKERIEVLEKKVEVIQEVLEETLEMLNGMNFVVRTTSTKKGSVEGSIKERVYKAIDKSIKESHGCDSFTEIPILEGEYVDEIAAQIQKLSFLNYITSAHERILQQKREICAVSLSIEEKEEQSILYMHWF